MLRIIALCVLFFASALAVSYIVEFSLKLSRKRLIALAGLSASAYAVVLYLAPEPALVGGLVGLVAAGFVGSLFGSVLLPTPQGLLTFLLTASMVDLMSVAGGPTKALIDAAAAGTSDLILYLAILLPWEGKLIPALGVSDLFGLAVMFASLRRQDFGAASTFVWGFCGILAALFVGLVRGGVAGYPFLAAAVVAALLLRKARDRKAA